ncbi:transposase [Streptomyces actuosus]|uniref:Transposase DDE domain-containing protein n=1 Tax=Streptomyces actuosus TaxID=1885 RepID=A0A2U9NUL8_STRAS|nr:hypothetical protein DMT42_00205 [Streptomyces actuosus]MBM4826607.1 transposase [Streptomyces actuosus]
MCCSAKDTPVASIRTTTFPGRRPERLPASPQARPARPCPAERPRPSLQPRQSGRPPAQRIALRSAKRNTVERAINKLKNYRAVATRCDKRGYVYLGTVTAAALLIWIRS